MPEIPRERLRVARNIDHGARGDLADRSDGSRVHARPRRVHRYHVHPFAVGSQSGHHVEHITRNERAVRHLVPFGILPGIPHGLLKDLDARDRTGPAGKQKRQRAAPAVEIHHMFRSGQTRVTQCQLVEPLGLCRVDLQERGGRHLDLEPQDAFADPIGSRQNPDGLRLRVPGPLPVHGENDALEPIGGLHQCPDWRSVREGSGRHQVHQGFARVLGVPDRHRPEQSCTGVGVVSPHPGVPKRDLHGLDDPIRQVRLQQARLQVEHRRHLPPGQRYLLHTVSGAKLPGRGEQAQHEVALRMLSEGEIHSIPAEVDLL